MLLGLSALAFGGIGMAFLIAPSAMGAHIGLVLASPAADGDVRAVYGGLEIGCAVWLALCAWRPDWLRAGLCSQVLLFAGLVGGRLVSWSLLGAPGALATQLLIAETAALAAGVLALALLSRRGRSKESSPAALE